MVFCVQLYDNLAEGDVPTADKVLTSFTSLFGKDDAEEVFGEGSEYDENRKVKLLAILEYVI